MRITAIETLHVEAYSNLVWVRVHTDQGLAGLGETFRNPKATIAYIHETCAPYLLGKDPRQVVRHADALVNRVGNRFVGYPTRSVEIRGNSGIDIALWDLLGKALGAPLHQLLGGLCRDSIRIYNTCASGDYNRIARTGSLSRAADEAESAPRPLDDLTAQLARPEELAHELLEEGVTAMKIWPFDRFAPPDGQHIAREALAQGLEPVRRIRAAVGERMDILIEYHALWQLPAIRQIAQALDAYGVYWHEDPVPMENFDDLAAFKAATSARVAGSESLGTRAWYKEVFARGAIDVAHFDLGWVGGITEGRKLAALAETHNRPIAPHDCTGPVQYCASVHLVLSAPNALFQETVRAFCRGYYTEVVTELPAIRDGHVHPLAGHGLGTELQPGIEARPDAHRQVSRLGD